MNSGCRSLRGRKIYGLAILWMVLASLSGCTEPPPPNVLIVSVDTLRADALGAFGNPKASTPNIDRLIAEGTYFTHTIAPMPRTTPALGSLLTGLEPKNHGSRDVGDAIRNVPTLAEALRESGYATLAVSANDSAGPKQKLDRGFDRFVTYGDLIEAYDTTLYRDLTEVPADQRGWAEVTNAKALELLDGVAPEKPYFLWVFYFDPHFLYRPPSPWQDGVEAERCWALYEHFGKHRKLAGQVFSNVGDVSTAALEDCRRLYDAEVSYTDYEIGRLLEELESRGRLDNTLIVFVADHGENFGEGGLFFEHGDNAHDAGLRVPLAFSGPGIERGKVDNGAVGLIDVAPTLLGWLGLPAPELAMDGLDLSERLRPGGEVSQGDRRRLLFAESATPVWNEAVKHVTTGRTWWRVCINGPRYALCEIPGEQPGVYLLYDHVEDPGLLDNVAAEHPDVVAVLLEAWKNWPPESARQRVAWSTEFKLVEEPRLDGSYKAQLYHLKTDPDETTDVSSEYPDVFRHMSAALDSWTDDLPALPERRPDPELEAALRSLGYVP